MTIMIWKLSIGLFAAGMLMIGIVVNAFDASAGNVFQPFSGRLSAPVVIALVFGIVMTVTGLAGLMPKYEQM